MGRLAVLLREPLVHFVALAFVLFLLTGNTSAPLVVDPAFTDAGSMNDPRSPAERTDAFVREELLVREARRLGLDRGDPIVRRRLAMKMEALIVSSVPDPTDDELRTFLRAHAVDFARLPRFSFRHVFYASRRSDPLGDARRQAEGDSFLMGEYVHQQNAQTLNGRFGREFGEQVQALHGAGTLEDGIVIESRFGAHRLADVEILPGGEPSLDEVRARVTAAWREVREREALDAALDELEANTVIER